MKEILTKIEELYQQFKADADKASEKGNKAAGVRARKTSLELTEKLKEFRKVSLNEMSKHEN